MAKKRGKKKAAGKTRAGAVTEGASGSAVVENREEPEAIDPVESERDEPEEDKEAVAPAADADVQGDADLPGAELALEEAETDMDVTEQASLNEKTELAVVSQQEEDSAPEGEPEEQPVVEQLTGTDVVEEGPEEDLKDDVLVQTTEVGATKPLESAGVPIPTHQQEVGAPLPTSGAEEDPADVQTLQEELDDKISASEPMETDQVDLAEQPGAANLPAQTRQNAAEVISDTKAQSITGESAASELTETQKEYITEPAASELTETQKEYTTEQAEAGAPAETEQNDTAELPIETNQPDPANNPSLSEVSAPHSENTTKQTEPVVVSKGPFSVEPLLPEIQMFHPETQTSSKPTYIETFETNIYIGTSNGEILHYFKIDSQYLLVSRTQFHHSRTKPISKMVALPALQKMLVISGGLLSSFQLPEFSPSNIGRIKDVHDISIDYDNSSKNDSEGVHVVIYTSTQIRIINVTPDAFRLIKDVPYKHSIRGLRRSQFTLVASQNHYDLLDLENFRKIPLFPVLTNGEPITPFIKPIEKKEFLLTSGSDKNEPCMGMIVNIHGDISRGTIPFEKYPESIGVEFPYVAVSFDHKVKIYSIHDQLVCQNVTFNGKVSVANVSQGFKFESEELSSLLQKKSLNSSEVDNTDLTEYATIETSLVCFTESFIKILVPTPRIVRLSKSETTTVNELEEELKSLDLSTKLGQLEEEYLNLSIGLKYLESNTFNSQCLASWTKSNKIDPKIMIVIFGYEVKGAAWVPNGLVKHINAVKLKTKDTNFNKFFGDFLAYWANSKEVDDDIKGLIESIIIKRSIHDDKKLLSLIDEEPIDKLLELLPDLRENCKYFATAKIYMRNKQFRESIDIYKRLIDGELNDLNYDKKENSNNLKLIIDTILHTELKDDSEFVWEFGLWLIGKDAELGLSFLHNDLLKLQLKNKEVLIISKIEDVNLKFRYFEKFLVKLNNEKNKANLEKQLYRSEARKLAKRLKKYSMK